jgi:hypothetical protein
MGNRNLLVKLATDLVREGAGNAAESRFQAGAEALHNGNDRNRDAGSDEAVFDRRGPGLVFHETRQKGLHGLAPKFHTWPSEADPTAFPHRLDRVES